MTNMQQMRPIEGETREAIAPPPPCDYRDQFTKKILKSLNIQQWRWCSQIGEFDLEYGGAYIGGEGGAGFRCVRTTNGPKDTWNLFFFKAPYF